MISIVNDKFAIEQFECALITPKLLIKKYLDSSFIKIVYSKNGLKDITVEVCYHYDKNIPEGIDEVAGNLLKILSIQARKVKISFHRYSENVYIIIPQSSFKYVQGNLDEAKK
jgi:hypothetical protein